jgi:hypothetical protein
VSPSISVDNYLLRLADSENNFIIEVTEDNQLKVSATQFSIAFLGSMFTSGGSYIYDYYIQCDVD